MNKTDRRGQRTRELLQKALIELISECEYSLITIQDIVDRAKVGRTTFYLHYNGKDDLFMSCHKAIVGKFHFGPRHSLSREELLAPVAPEGMASAYRHLEEGRAQLYPVFLGRDGSLILRHIRDQSAQEIETNLRTAFTEVDSTISFNVLATYLAGAQIAMVQWWLEKRRPHTPEDLAQTFHRLQRAAIRDVFGIKDGK
ncbi:MAG: TetR/AcrR family transcriptional regulator [Anaerolineae bacterium]|nr:TetR/AcrR family transcriptional regulator [Anaerolineae bacterium]